VDEYQDTNRIQADIIDLLAERHGNVMVVGDDSQSIYSFRGANFANILSFPDRYPGTKINKLEINYRSTPEILHLANSSIVFNRYQFPKELRTVRPEGSVPSLVPVQDVLEQAYFVAQKIDEIRDEATPLSEIAVLYRAHYHSMELQMELTRRGIPFQVRSGLRFFEQAHIKDVCAYLKVVCNPLDELAWNECSSSAPRWERPRRRKSGGWSLRRSESLGGPGFQGDGPEGSGGGAGGLADALENPVPAAQGRKDFRPRGNDRRGHGGGYEAYLQAKYPNFESRADDLRQLAVFAGQYASCQDFLSDLALLTSIESEAQPFEGGMECSP